MTERAIYMTEHNEEWEKMVRMSESEAKINLDTSKS
jgi:hypothetical protein